MKRRLARHGVVIWLIAPLLLSVSLYRPVGTDRGRAAKLPTRLAGFERVEDYELTDSVLAMLGTSDAVWRRYAADAGEVFVVAVFHDENWKSVHAPDTCLRGSNMDVVEDGTVTVRSVDGQDWEYGRLRLQALDRGSGYLSLFVYLAAPRFATGDYWSFFLHHAPAALFRRNVSGCLLRVESWIGPDGVDAAEARCTAVLRELVGASWDLLR